MQNEITHRPQGGHFKRKQKLSTGKPGSPCRSAATQLSLMAIVRAAAAADPGAGGAQRAA